MKRLSIIALVLLISSCVNPYAYNIPRSHGYDMYRIPNAHGSFIRDDYSILVSLEQTIRNTSDQLDRIKDIQSLYIRTRDESLRLQYLQAGNMNREVRNSHNEAVDKYNKIALSSTDKRFLDMVSRGIMERRYLKR